MPLQLPYVQKAIQRDTQELYYANHPSIVSFWEVTQTIKQMNVHIVKVFILSWVLCINKSRPMWHLMFHAQDSFFPTEVSRVMLNVELVKGKKILVKHDKPK